VVKVWVALEALLGDSAAPRDKSKRMSHDVLEILQLERSEKLIVSKRLDAFYADRNAAVHEGKPPAPDAVARYGDLVSRIVITVAGRLAEWHSYSKFQSDIRSSHR